MINVPGYLLLRNLKTEILLAGFDDPDRGLSLDTPVWLPIYAVGFEPFNEFTGEFAGNRFALGTGIFRMAESLWKRCPDLVARNLTWNSEQRKRVRRDGILTPTQAAKLGRKIL